MEYYFYGTDRCSIKGISSDYRGAIYLSKIASCLLETSHVAIAFVQRPYGDNAQTSSAAVSNLAGEITELKRSNDGFRLSFYYPIQRNNDAFIDAFVRLWKEYEYPGFFFFRTSVSSESFSTIL